MFVCLFVFIHLVILYSSKCTGLNLHIDLLILNYIISHSVTINTGSVPMVSSSSGAQASHQWKLFKVGRVGSTKCSLFHTIQIDFLFGDLLYCISKRFAALFPSQPAFVFMSRVVEKNEEQMQYHLNSSCFSSEVMVEIQVRIQWSGGKRLSGQVKVHNWCNILRP